MGSRPTILLGNTSSRRLLLRMRDLRWGRMWSPGRTPSRHYDDEPVGIDNGAFGCWRRGAKFDEGKFVAHVAAAERSIGRPFLAVLPDVVGGGEESLDYSLSWLVRLPASWPWYLAVQDGMIESSVRRAIGPLAGVFLGGTTEFKKTARVWCGLAHGEGKSFHFGRCCRRSWFEEAIEIGADSIDTTQPLWSENHWRRFIGWTMQRLMFDGVEEQTHRAAKVKPKDGTDA